MVLADQVTCNGHDNEYSKSVKISFQAFQNMKGVDQTICKASKASKVYVLGR